MTTLRATGLNGGHHARFVALTAEPDRTAILQPDHPAVVEGRTIFPSRVIGADDSQRYLVGGRNNAKIGAEVLKGAWRGMPIYTLTLEERATCPRSCHMWQGCYGSSMPHAPRRDHRDPLFMETLKGEISTLARSFPKGVVIRLHVLGDFFSLVYVRMWADMLDRFPQLHVYGYTARRTDMDSLESRKIAAALEWMAETHWDAFAIRQSSNESGRQRAIVVDEPVTSENVIMCPAQTHATETCGTCGLCWNEAMRDKTIGFLRHGMKRRWPGIDRGAQVRLDLVPESEKERIAREYGVVWKAPA